MPEDYKQTEEYKNAFKQFQIAKPDELYNVYKKIFEKTPTQKREIINAAFSHYISTPEGQSKLDAAVKAQERREEVVKQMSANINGMVNSVVSVKTHFIEVNTELAKTMNASNFEKIEKRNKCLPLFDESNKFVLDVSKTFNEITQQFKEGKLSEKEYVTRCAALITALQNENTRLVLTVAASLEESDDSKKYLTRVAGTFKEGRDKMFKIASGGGSAEQVVADIKNANSHIAKNLLMDTDFISMVRMWHGVDQSEVAEATNRWLAAEKSLKKIANGEDITYADIKNISAFVALNVKGIRAREERETRAIATGVYILSGFAVSALTPIVSEYVGSRVIGGVLTGGFSEAGSQLGLDAMFGRVNEVSKYVTMFGIGAFFGGAIAVSEASAATIGAGKIFAKNVRRLPNLEKYLENMERLYKGSHIVHAKEGEDIEEVLKE